MPIQDRRHRRRRLRRLPPPPESTSTTGSDSEHSSRAEQNEFEEMSEGGHLSDGGLDLESGELERKVHSGGAKRECRERRECRICQVGDGGGVLIELGCFCKGDLGSAHTHCAETWFKIRGNTICEICGATALNVTGEQINDPNTTVSAVTSTSAPATTVTLPETQRFWHGRRLMNILFGCMVFAFIVSWVFHFNLLPHH